MINKYDGTTSNLMISNKNLDCSKVCETLIRNGVCCNISKNTSIVYNHSSDKCEKENGCMVTICGLNRKYIEKDVWEPLRDEYNLSCAHLEVQGHYTGCILNFIRPSACAAISKKKD